KCVNSELFQNENKWILETPYDVRKKDESESIVIHSKHWKKAGVFYPRIFGTEPIRGAEPLPNKLNHDCRLQKTRLGEFFLCIPMPLEIRGENQAPQWTRIEEGILSLDPGVRTFSTGYSPSGLVVEWGKNDIGRIYHLCHALDKLQSKWSKKEVRYKKSYKLKKEARRIRKKIRTLFDEVYKKFTKWIVEQYHIVLLPEFGTQRMVRRANRRIRNIKHFDLVHLQQQLFESCKLNCLADNLRYTLSIFLP
ncbi:18931_t:CDS:2, partial [Racocetra fulgida]